MKFHTFTILLGVSLAVFATSSLTLASDNNPQNEKTTTPVKDVKKAQATQHDESRPPDSVYIKPEKILTSPARRWVRDRNVSVQVNVNASGMNILGDAANEPSIAVDPTNPQIMAIGWRQFDTVASNFRQAGWGYTTDGGQTWTFPGVIEPGKFRSDPVLDSDADGNFYYNSLTNDPSFYCDVFISTDGGQTWGDGTYAYGGDKQWMAIDRTGGIGHGNIYSNWTIYYSDCNGNFTRSYDGGQTYTSCIDVIGSPDPYWGVTNVGPDGEVYVIGAGLHLAKSSTLQNSSLPPQWDFGVHINMGGDITYGDVPNPGGLLGQAWVATDHSDGPSRGNVYALASIDPQGSDPLDVMFSRSTNGGQTWSTPVRVNAVRDGWQWFGTMSVAPNGRIDVIWNDTRNDPSGHTSELHYSYSEDTGITWSPAEVLTPPFNSRIGWPDQNKIGDYYDMVSDNDGANLAFSATFNGEQDVYYMRIGDFIQCPADLTGDEQVNIDDIFALLGLWGDCPDPCPPYCTGDLTEDCTVNIDDIFAILGMWGPCE